jgi:transposase
MMAYNQELEIENVGFVLDRGFCTTANVKFLDVKGYNFILGIEKRHKATLAAIEQVRDGIISMQNLTDQGIYAAQIKGCFYGTSGTMNIFYDPELAERQRKDIYRTVESKEEILTQLKKMLERDAKGYRKYFTIYINENGTPVFKRNYLNINNMENNCGFFCILTNTSLDTSQVLARYRRKDVIEKNFDDLKNHLDMKRLRTHHTATTDGKLFCSFISLIVVSEIMVKLGPLMKKKCMSKDTIVRELEKICVIVASNDRRLINPLTKFQRNILEVFGIGEEELKAYVSRVV